MPIQFMVNHLCARLPIGNISKTKIGQTILMSDTDGLFYTRVVLEPTPIFKEIHVLKLARELTDALTHPNESKLKTWEIFQDEDIVFSAKYHDNIAFLFVSDKEYDFQFGVVHDVCGIDGRNLANLICHMLNGKDIDKFKFSMNGRVDVE